MLENTSQHIACDFDVSQELWNVPSWVYSIAVCGWALSALRLEGVVKQVKHYHVPRREVKLSSFLMNLS